MLPNTPYLIEKNEIHPPLDPRKEREGGSFFDFDLVQERLIAAMLICWRMPDRETSWLHVKAHWPDVLRHNFFGDYGDTEAMPRAAALTRRDVAEMEEAFAWMAFVKDRDRKLVAMAVSRLARGDNQVAWGSLKKAMGVQFGSDGLRKRYGRAIESICKALNAAKVLGCA